MFTSDHGLTADCEGVGHGDSAIYPGARAETGEQTTEPRRRANQTITRCDIHHNTLGYSGTMGNGTRVVDNHFYDNGDRHHDGLVLRRRPPGLPAGRRDVREEPDLLEQLQQLRRRAPTSSRRCRCRWASGILIAGGNGNEIRGNRIYDNWRRGTMLINVPDSLSDETADDTVNSVSHRNRYHDNVMGIAPERHEDAERRGLLVGRGAEPAGQLLVRQRRGRRTDPPGPLTPSNCDNTSAGVTYPAKLSGELAPCAGSIAGGGYDADHLPVVPDARRSRRPTTTAADGAAGCRRPAAPEAARCWSGDCRLVGSTLSCDGLLDRP